MNRPGGSREFLFNTCAAFSSPFRRGQKAASFSLGVLQPIAPGGWTDVKLLLRAAREIAEDYRAVQSSQEDGVSGMSNGPGAEPSDATSADDPV